MPPKSELEYNLLCQLGQSRFRSEQTCGLDLISQAIILPDSFNRAIYLHIIQAIPAIYRIGLKTDHIPPLYTFGIFLDRRMLDGRVTPFTAQSDHSHPVTSGLEWLNETAIEFISRQTINKPFSNDALTWLTQYFPFESPHVICHYLGLAITGKPDQFKNLLKLKFKTLRHLAIQLYHDLGPYEDKPLNDQVKCSFEVAGLYDTDYTGVINIPLAGVKAANLLSVLALALGIPVHLFAHQLFSSNYDLQGELTRKVVEILPVAIPTSVFISGLFDNSELFSTFVHETLHHLTIDAKSNGLARHHFIRKI